jgi:hypothetical protein
MRLKVHQNVSAQQGQSSPTNEDVTADPLAQSAFSHALDNEPGLFSR